MYDGKDLAYTMSTSVLSTPFFLQLLLTDVIKLWKSLEGVYMSEPRYISMNMLIRYNLTALQSTTAPSSADLRHAALDGQTA